MSAPANPTDVGFILLLVDTDVPLWSEVEWKNGNEDWHLVDGWMGPLEETATGMSKRWTIPGHIFGKGPFRWTLYKEQNDELLGQSEIFYMPTTDEQVVKVTVNLEDETLMENSPSSSASEEGSQTVTPTLLPETGLPVSGWGLLLALGLIALGGAARFLRRS